MMRWDTTLRAFGVIGLVAAYAVYRFSAGELSVTALGMIVTAIVGIVAPEVVDQLPFGPSK